MIMTKEQMATDLRDKMDTYEYETVIKLIKVWVDETNNGIVPPTPMSEWNSFVENHSDKLDWTKITQFREYDTWFYIDSYGLTSTDYLIDDIANASVFYDCRNYWAETYERYQRAIAILNGDEYIIISNNMEIYI